MNVLILGSGGRECAISSRLSKSPEIDKLYVLPGNGGIKKYATCIPGSVTDIGCVKKAVEDYAIDYCVVTPDDPLAIGMVDALSIPCFGPKQAAARIESSKAFAKELMKKYSIPTARYKVFSSYDEALGYVDNGKFPTVIKADGLALGKGVVIANTKEEAKKALKEMMLDKKFGQSGCRVVIEEFLEGPEVTVLAFTDGKTIKPMISSMDHKRAYDGDKGPNTGGMGCIAPNPCYTKDIEKEAMDKIILPTIKALEDEGCPFSGCLYFGLMVTKDGVKVIEYNSRFGDPEAQTVLPLLKSDLFEIMKACTYGYLDRTEIKWSEGSSCSVVLASSGYPGSYEKGKEITIPENLDAEVFIAGAEEKDGRLFTSSGRVVNVTATGKDLKEAVEKAYKASEMIFFEGKTMRRDIGKKALEA